MNKIKLPFRRIILVLLLLPLFFSMYAKSNSYLGEFTYSEVEQKLDALGADVDFKLTSEVKKYLNQYIVSYRHSSETLIGRSQYYFPRIEDKLFEKNLPLELKYLAIVESSLKPSARSKAGATGMWQFMKATGKMYGLQIDNNIDERRDVDKSTEAALNYLTDLHDRFGDWTLALAAYNCGPGNVSKAMRKSGGKNYWSIRSHLPRETRNYIPKFIAMAYLMNYYHEHGLMPISSEEYTEPTRKVFVSNGISFNEVSKMTGLAVEKIQKYNPCYIENYIPKNEAGYMLVLPSEVMYKFLDEKGMWSALVPDPRQDRSSEVQVSSQVLEKKALLSEVLLLNKLDGLLREVELKSTMISEESEIKLSAEIIRNTEQITLSSFAFASESKSSRRSSKRKSLLRIETGAMIE